MHPVDVLTLEQYQVLINLVATIIGAIASSMISFSIYLSWKRERYLLLKALMILFGVLAFNQFIASITNIAYLLDSHKILVLPLFEYRQVIFTTAIVYVFLRLWLRNHKAEKLLRVVEASHKTANEHDIVQD